MGIHYYISHPTTPAGSGFTDELVNRVPYGTLGLQTFATVGDAASSGITLDDPDGDLDYTFGLSSFFVEEDTCPAGDQRVWNGYVGEQSISRGGAADTLFATGAGRQWDLSLQDTNTILSMRLIGPLAGSPAPYEDRPAESGSARLAWLLSVDHVGSVLNDHGLIDWAGLAGIDMDPNNYQTSRPKDVLADLSIPSGFAFWAQYNEANNDIELAMFDVNTSTAFASTVTISNVEADVDWETCFAPSEDSVLHRDPTNIAAGVMVTYQGTPGVFYDYDLDTSYEFGFRDQMAPTSSIKTATAASALAIHYLGQHDEQEEVIDTRIWLPPSKLTAIRAGHRIESVRFSHFPGYETGRVMRVQEHTLRSFDRSVGLYEIGLKLSPTGGACGITDTWQRTIADGWGTCDAGIDWINSEGGSGSSSVDGARGVFSNAAGFGASATLYHGVASVIDATFEIQFGSLPSSESWRVDITAVPDDLSNDAYLMLTFTGVNAGKMRSFRQNGALTANYSDYVASPHVTTDPLKIHLYCNASETRAKVWLAADPEPESWMLVHSFDLTADPGKDQYFAVYCNGSASAFAGTIYLDNLDIVSLPPCNT